MMKLILALQAMVFVGILVAAGYNIKSNVATLEYMRSQQRRLDADEERIAGLEKREHELASDLQQLADADLVFMKAVNQHLSTLDRDIIVLGRYLSR